MGWMDYVMGAGSGAAAGGAIGGPWGAAIGGGIGLLGAILHKGPAGAPAEDPAVRSAALADVANLRAAANGTNGPSAVDRMLALQTARATAGQYAIGDTLQSRTPGAAARIASEGARDVQTQGAEQAATVKMQEQQQARQQLTAADASLRSGDMAAITAKYNADTAAAAQQNLYQGSLLSGAAAGGARALAPTPGAAVAPVAAPAPSLSTLPAAPPAPTPAPTFAAPAPVIAAPPGDQTYAYTPYYRSPSVSVGQR